MPTPYTPTPGDGYMSADPFVRAQLVARGATGASPDTQIQTQAVSMLTPGVVVRGGSGTDQNGVPTQYQAYTTNGREGVIGTPGQSMSPDPVFRPASDTMPMRAQYGSDAAYLQAYNAYQAAGQPSWVQRPTTPPTPASGTSGTGTSGTGTAGTGTGTSSTGEPTAGQVYSGFTPTGNPELDAAYAAQRQQILDTQKPMDEQSIREATMKRFQAEIDATNQYYNEVKRQRQADEAQRGLARVGTGVAIQARRGLIGSDFGTAQGQMIDTYNAGVQDSIARAVDAEKNNAIQEILGKARTESQKEIDAKVAARTQGAQNYIDFLKGAATRKEERANSAIANLIASGVTPDDATYKALAAELGIDESTLKTKYKNGSDAAKVEATKNAPKPIIVDGTAYEVQADGTYKAVTPAKAAPVEKPIIVGGVAYDKQADGTYKAVTPVAAVKPLTRQVGKVLMTSLDNGLTWAPASAAGSPPGTKPKALPSSGTKTGTGTKTVSETKAVQAMNGQLGQLIGGDGFLSPQDYSAAKNAWIKQGYNPTTFDTKFRGYRNPENPYYGVGGSGR